MVQKHLYNNIHIFRLYCLSSNAFQRPLCSNLAAIDSSTTSASDTVNQSVENAGVAFVKGADE